MLSTPSLPLEPFDQAKKRTKEASIAAYVSASLTAVVSIASVVSQRRPEPLVLLIDAVLIAGLGYGTQKQSRVCAATLVIYWIISKWFLWQDSALGLVGILVAFGFGLIFIGGMVGAINFHRHKGKPNQSLQRTPGSESFPSAESAPRRL